MRSLISWVLWKRRKVGTLVVPQRMGCLRRLETFAQAKEPRSIRG